ncbi:YnbE family lipoprotein [Phenylobacterium sp.]|jgi:hypothetical protein|uniref:YnbE family lipoprotein n=1 Tax=Phenylobacterium sp. TaxID=1871053 RepID=UPI001B4B2623|nr:YnbE family lipoprotein [Phenylobacterium sp.]MBP7648546.1 YnbE family lipoprotein [Phenylobacterium sp.]MBP7816263.1 YnbE family lipoprotein [Phenylobacterium sp.]MBP9231317.1 YnbE family lipoprotein [Phenylobacterium sp.]MBP9753749.1 YnbE family lipoprotein [Phenylobacterium sp.]MDO8801857.1 YnbE family lipoprotein [Phenylobacterium sp.]
MTSARPLAALAATAVFASVLGACATVHVDVKPITIYAKLDADVRLRLDDDVKALIKQNPDLF